MTYELAKELKDAGFPPKGKGEYNIQSFMEKGGTDLVYYPTLSELIEASMPYFEYLYCEPRITRGGAVVEEGGWTAWSRVDDIRVHAQTPEEAVAKLWLALHTKNEQ